jgi:hypothetical protein
VVGCADLLRRIRRLLSESPVLAEAPELSAGEAEEALPEEALLWFSSAGLSVLSLLDERRVATVSTSCTGVISLLGDLKITLAGLNRDELARLCAGSGANVCFVPVFDGVEPEASVCGWKSLRDTELVEVTLPSSPVDALIDGGIAPRRSYCLATVLTGTATGTGIFLFLRRGASFHSSPWSTVSAGFSGELWNEITFAAGVFRDSIARFPTRAVGGGIAVSFRGISGS